MIETPATTQNPSINERSLSSSSRRVTGRFFLDDEVLRNAGVSDFSAYRPAGVAEADLIEDFFL